MIGELPTALEVGGELLRIRSDFRVVLNIYAAWNDPELTPEEQCIVCICNFTPMPWELQIALPGEGTLRCLLDSDDPRFGGAGSRGSAPVRAVPEEFFGHSHSALLPLPPLSCAYYGFSPAPAPPAAH